MKIRSSITCIATAAILLFSCIPTMAATSVTVENSLTRATLNNGIRLLIDKKESNNVVAVYLYLDGGSAYDPTGKVGITNLVQNTINKGTTTRSALDIARDAESLGAHIGTMANRETAGAYCISTVSVLPKALDIFADVMTHPTFPTNEVENEKMRTIQQIQSLTDDPVQATILGYLNTYYGHHPYGRPSLGIVDDVAQLKRDDIIDWYKRLYNPNRMVLSVVGNVDPESIMTLLEQKLSEIGRVNRSIEDMARPELDGAGKEQILTKDMQATFMAIGVKAPTASSPDKPVMDVLNNVLGGGFASRLMKELREKQGLVYFAQSIYVASEVDGTLVSVAATNPAMYEVVREAIKAQIDALRREPVPEQELEIAKAYTLGTRLLSMETNVAIAGELARTELTRPGISDEASYVARIKTITAAEVMKTANDYFGNPTVYVVMPPR